MAIGWALITVTFLLVIVGCGLYVMNHLGWAQLMWVLASGTAGSGVALIIEHRHDT